jgi:uncharacterized protein (UPF0332 family)
MSRENLTPEAMIRKAERACRSARTLLVDDDPDGAANRAYYAMFDAARAALLASDAPVNIADIRAHVGLVYAFSEHLVEKGPIPENIGSLLDEARHLRGMADYSGISLDPNVANEIVDHAEIFVAAMRTEFLPDNSTDKDDGPSP